MKSLRNQTVIFVLGGLTVSLLSACAGTGTENATMSDSSTPMNIAEGEGYTDTPSGSSALHPTLPSEPDPEPLNDDKRVINVCLHYSDSTACKDQCELSVSEAMNENSDLEPTGFDMLVEACFAVCASGGQPPPSDMTPVPIEVEILPETADSASTNPPATNLCISAFL